MYLLKIKPILIQRHTALITLTVLCALSVVCNVGCGDSATITQETPTEMPACDNGVRDGDEADIDCGGSCETACVIGKTCAENNDCDSSRCVESLCVCAEGSEVQDGLCVNSTTCADNPCGENATCAESGSAFTCACAEGFEGDGMTCADIDECANTPCGEGATCTNTEGGFTCACAEGLEGDGMTCTDVDECATNPCGENATCANTEGGFTCACADGFEGDGMTCADVDECANTPCDTNATCTNTEGTFTCACAEGFEGDGLTCADIDECADNPCGANATCTNSAGGFTCACAEGFEGDGVTCADIDECATTPCGENATCANNEGGFTCRCDDGYTGDGQTCSVASDCAEIFANNPSAVSGVYNAAPLGEVQQVWCEMSSEGAWTLWNNLAVNMVESNAAMPRCGLSREVDCYAGTYVARGYRAGVYYIEADGTTVQQLNDDLTWTERYGAREDRGACSQIFYCASGNDICLFSYLVDEESCCTNPNMSNFCLE